MSDIAQYKTLDDIIMQELNVHHIVRRVLESDKGTLMLDYDGKNYRFLLNDEDVTTPKLLEQVPAIIDSIQETTNGKR